MTKIVKIEEIKINNMGHEVAVINGKGCEN